MLIIRLTRVGKRNQPLFRFIVSEKARDPWGNALEILGTYDPKAGTEKIEINKERIQYWISKGAQCSKTVHNMMIDQKILTGDKKKKNTVSKRRKEKLAKKTAG